LEIMEEICEKYLFVCQGKVRQYADWQEYTADEDVRNYLGDKITSYEQNHENYIN
jgi:hypothetical protein